MSLKCSLPFSSPASAAALAALRSAGATGGCIGIRSRGAKGSSPRSTTMSAKNLFSASVSGLSGSIAALPEKMPRSIQRGPSTPTMRVFTVLPPLTLTGSFSSVPNTPSTSEAALLASSRSPRTSSHSPRVLGAAKASISRLEEPKVMVEPSTCWMARLALMRSWMPWRKGR